MRPKWKKTSEVKPTEEKQYLCCNIHSGGTPYFKVLWWSNNLYKVDEYDFYKCKDKSGFYDYDSEWGYVSRDCDYWKAINWSEDEV